MNFNFSRTLLVGTIFFVSLLSWSSLALAQRFDPEGSEYDLLSNKRSSITIPKTSLAQKKLILEQAIKIISELYVHRQLKIKTFGPDADALPALSKIEIDLPSLSDIEFHRRMLLAFERVHDLHTTYRMPYPYKCFRTMLPFTLTFATKEDGTKFLVVDKVAIDPSILNLSPDFLKVRPSDTLLTYDGKPALDVVKSLRGPSHGANPSADLRYGADLLAFRSAHMDLIPNQDSVKLGFQNLNGEVYSVELPWIAKTIKSCLLSPPIQETTLVGRNERKFEIETIFKTTNRNFKSNDIHDFKDSKEPFLKFKKISHKRGVIGVLKLDAFDSLTRGDDELASEIKRVVSEELGDTDAMIIDLRSNFGGWVWVAESMVQLFAKSEVIPLSFRLRNSPSNLSIFESETFSPQFLSALKATEKTQDLSVPVPLFTDINLTGQVYDKPVALFVNANCYSSCDMFSAQMQDQTNAVIFGEDEHTGGGGANVWNVDHVLARYPGKDFLKKLPNGQNITFSFREPLRTGKNSGKIIEGQGVKPDVIIPFKASDVLNQSSEQYKNITEKLFEQGHQS